MSYTPLRLPPDDPLAAKAAKAANLEGATRGVCLSPALATLAALADIHSVATIPIADTERAAIIEYDGGAPREWAEGFARLEALPSPPDVNAPTWLEMMDAAGRFLDRWGAKAAALGWSSSELFGLDNDSPFRRLDRRGAAFFLIRREVIGITAAEITLRDGGNVLTMRRRKGFTLPAWERTTLRG